MLYPNRLCGSWCCKNLRQWRNRPRRDRLSWTCPGFPSRSRPLRCRGRPFSARGWWTCPELRNSYWSVGVEGIEHLVDLGSAVLLSNLGSGKTEELAEVDASWLVLIELGEDLIHELVLAGEAQVDEGLLELSGVHDAAAVVVEDLEGLSDVDDLLAGKGDWHKIIGVEWLFVWDCFSTFSCSCGRLCWWWVGVWRSSFLHKIFY